MGGLFETRGQQRRCRSDRTKTSPVTGWSRPNEANEVGSDKAGEVISLLDLAWYCRSCVSNFVLVALIRRVPTCIPTDYNASDLIVATPRDAPGTGCVLDVDPSDFGSAAAL